MNSRNQTWFVLAGSTILWLAGCDMPREIAPVAPPGFELTRKPPEVQGEGAQAIGEQKELAKTPAKSAQPVSTLISPPTPIGQPTKTASGLVYETLKEGTGPVAQPGQIVTIHYTGTLTDGQVFDSSKKRAKPYSTKIGVRSVIGGWDEGVPGMKVGEVRKLTIPPELGYGAIGQGSIPGNATLIFELELIGVE